MSSKIEVNVTDSGVQFGGAWFSHERITGYTAEQLNSGNCCVTGKQYMKWLSNAAAPVVERQPVCSKCNDTGEVDSGGVQPWGEGINVTCDCQLSPPELAELQAPTNGAIIKDLTEVIAQQAAEIERLKGGQGEQK